MTRAEAAREAALDARKLALEAWEALLDASEAKARAAAAWEKANGEAEAAHDAWVAEVMQEEPESAAGAGPGAPR